MTACFACDVYWSHRTLLSLSALAVRSLAHSNYASLGPLPAGLEWRALRECTQHNSRQLQHAEEVTIRCQTFLWCDQFWLIFLGSVYYSFPTNAFPMARRQVGSNCTAQSNCRCIECLESQPKRVDSLVQTNSRLECSRGVLQYDHQYCKKPRPCWILTKCSVWIDR